MYIWLTAMVRPMYPKYFIPNCFLSALFCANFYVEALIFSRESIHADRLFSVHRECFKDPNVQWADEIHESTTYLCHRPRCCGVYPTAEGKYQYQSIL